jgi:hypothetical protein
VTHDEPTASAEEAAFIYQQWHERAAAGDGPGVLDLYAQDAIFESPLVPRLLDRPGGIVQGHDALIAFFLRSAVNRPTDLIKGYRTGRYQFDGRTLHWEYPRMTPDGDQLDLSECMDIEGGKIVHHRVYWGWMGSPILTERKSRG